MTIVPFPAKERGKDRRNDQRCRLTLPVAPRANTRIRFAAVTDRTMTAITPDEAVALVDRLMDEGGPLEGADIAGPGEPLATPHATIECLSRLQRDYPALDLGMVTNGMGGARLLDGLKESGLRRITLCVNAVTTVTAEKIYAWIRPGSRTVPLAQAAVTLLKEQATTAAICSKVGLAVRIATTVYPGFNDGEVEEIALKMAGMGVENMTLLPYLPLPGDMGCLVKPDAELMARLAKLATRHLQVVEDRPGVAPAGGRCCGRTMAELSRPKPGPGRPNVAVTSESGMAVDQHLGQATRLLIYGPREDGPICLLEARPAPAPGGGGERWHAMARIASDCFALLTASAGDTPRATLNNHGVKVVIADGDIEGTVDALYQGRKKK
ncbi:MAG: NifB/NifX family molybdenum-iron cluster-binding protein [Desulfobulbaceae bacterium]